MLHLLNGDATAAVFAPAGLPGAPAVWRDILMEGPVSAGAATPAAMPGRVPYLTERLAIDAEEYGRVSREQEAALARAEAEDEVVLWFEQDLFCAVNLWFVLSRLAPRPPARLSLVFPPTDTTPGLGARAPADLVALFAGRRPLDPETIGAGRAAWTAYASPDPTAAESLLAAGVALPFVSGAARCHLGRLPSTGDGLNESERAVLTALRDGPLAFAALFARVTADPVVRRHGAGDVQMAGLLREMRAGPRPLVTVHDAERASRDWTLTITPAGRDVLDGRADRLACSLVDRWLGGVHLAPGHPTWRWDGARVVAA
jgi:hypothetical protein